MKNECINLYSFEMEGSLYQVVEEFAYVNIQSCTSLIALITTVRPIRRERQHKWSVKVEKINAKGMQICVVSDGNYDDYSSLTDMTYKKISVCQFNNFFCE